MSDDAMDASDATDARDAINAIDETAGTPPAPVVHLPRIPEQPAPEITSRFLFVDVAAMRAKQLRNGALVRLDKNDGRPVPIKLERMAMEEVKRQLVEYDVPPEPTSVNPDE
jgi:DNA-directed RNA polymerase subunit K/omega